MGDGEKPLQTELRVLGDRDAAAKARALATVGSLLHLLNAYHKQMTAPTAKQEVGLTWRGQSPTCVACRSATLTVTPSWGKDRTNPQ